MQKTPCPTYTNDFTLLKYEYFLYFSCGLEDEGQHMQIRFTDYNLHAGSNCVGPNGVGHIGSSARLSG